MKRFVFIDVLKAIAIIAVVLYHFGYAPAGYLGVDLFLVINGFLLSTKFGELETVLGGVDFLSIELYDFRQYFLPVLLYACSGVLAGCCRTPIKICRNT